MRSYACLVILCVFIKSLQQQEFTNGKECFVYNVLAGKSLKLSIKGSSFNVGFLKLSSGDPPQKVQIQISTEDKVTNSTRKFQVYIAEKGLVYLKDRDDKDFPLLINSSLEGIGNFPAWYYLVIRIQDEEFSVSRPGDFGAIVSSKVQHIDAFTSDIQVNLSDCYYVTINCLADCPIYFSDHWNTTLEFSLHSSFYINLMHRKRIEDTENALGYFNYSLSVSSKTNISLSAEVEPGMQLTFYLSMTAENIDPTTTEVGWQIQIFHNNESIFVDKFREYNFTFTIVETKNVFWSFNCKNTINGRRMHTNDIDREGRALYSPETQEHTNYQTSFSVGEVAAWVVASLSLCGLIIIGLTLYSRVSNSEWMNEMANDASMSHIGTFELLPPSQRNKKSVFYAELRRPEEGSESEVGRQSSVIVDHLYPLELSIGHDDRSLFREELCDSIRSCDTVITKIAKE